MQATAVDTRPVMEHLGYLDGWRGCAILFLLIGHFFPLAGLNLGRFGVELFFVLSGLLMSRLLFVKKVALPLFFKRRFARVFPAHYCFLTLLSVYWLATHAQFNLRDIITAATFTLNYLNIDHPSTLPVGHVWSLCVEEHSYLMLGLLAFITRTRSRSALPLIAVLVASCAAFGIYYASHAVAGTDPYYTYWLHTEVAGFGIFCSSLVTVYLERQHIKPVWGWLTPGLLLLALAVQWWSIPLPIRLIVGLGSLSLAVSLLPVAPRWLLALLDQAPLRWLGKYSFSIYLWQQPFYHVIDSAMPIWQKLGLLAAALVAGILSFHLVENPVRLMLNRTWSRA